MQNNSTFNPSQSQPLIAAQPTAPAVTSAQPHQPTAPASSFNPTTSQPSMSASQFSTITTQPTAQSTQSSPIQQRAFQPAQPLSTQFQPTAPQSQSFNTAQPAQPVRTAQANSVMSTATNVATTQLNQATQFNPISSAAPTATAVTSAQSTATTSPFNPLMAQPAAPAAASLQPITPAQPTTSATSGYTGAGFAAIDPSVLAPNTPANNTNGTSTSAFNQLTTQAGNIIADRPTLPSQQFSASQVPQSRLPHYVTAVATPPNSFKNILCEALIPVSTSGYCTSRRTYILAATVQVVVVTLLMILCVVLAASGMGLLDLLVFPFAIIYFVVSLFMLMRRRLCDAGKPTWLRFLVFTPAAPVVCFIANFAPSIQWQDNVPRYLSFFSKK